MRATGYRERLEEFDSFIKHSNASNAGFSDNKKAGGPDWVSCFNLFDLQVFQALCFSKLWLFKLIAFKAPGFANYLTTITT